MPGRRSALAWAAGLLAAGPMRPSWATPSTALHRLHTGDLGLLLSVDATLGGRPWRALIDSGATGHVVTPALAARLGLPVVGRVRVATVGGTLSVDRVELPELEIAGRRLDATHALVLDLERHLGAAAAAVDGIVGASALRAQSTRLDIAAGELGFDGAADAAARAVWPLRWDQDLPVVDLALGGRDPAPFLLDTGNAGALLVFAGYANRLGVGARDLPALTLRELGGTVTVHPALLERLEAPGYAAREVPVVFEVGPQARRGAHFDRLAGSVGLALFAGGALTLDGAGRRVIVEGPGLPEPPPLPGGFGFTLGDVLPGAPVVGAVYDGGPAARAGVRPGQRLRALDDASLDAVAVLEVWRRLHGRAQARFDFDGMASPVVLARERFFARWR